ncbi:hypothetical protein QMK50_23840 [Pseudomonas sp. P5_152]|uniref:hypothetical protein n=1 Tax=Pseudomonas sp. P5_152 TaxID=3043442 RepID=UPI002A362CB6|nr:hypothetical protein [Pseudomonas sp. P5_152]MDX9667986.1 hypothetical protein [Pseudomonas sp. P5_152]
MSDLKKYRNRFVTVLAVSLVLLMATSSEVLNLNPQVAGPAPGPPLNVVDGAGFIAVVSMFTSAVSLIGLLLTTGIAWRKERRESRTAKIDNEKKELEVQLLRLNLEQKRQENTTSIGDSTDPP